MINLFVTINHRDYLVGCADGEQDRLKVLAAKLNNRIEELSQSIGQLGDARLLVIASLMILDELDSVNHPFDDSQDDDSLDYELDESQLNNEEEDESLQIDTLIQNNLILENKLKDALAEGEILKSIIANATIRLEKLGLEKP